MEEETIKTITITSVAEEEDPAEGILEIMADVDEAIILRGIIITTIIRRTEKQERASRSITKNRRKQKS